MSTAKRRIDPSVIERLFAEPYRFEFFQAVRMLELEFAKQDSERKLETLPHRLLFRNSLSLAFPSSEIAKLSAHDSDGKIIDADDLMESLSAGKLASVNMTPAFFGLLGNLGALPHHYTERLAEREIYSKDTAARAFLDIFSNRATALFYSAWKKYRLPIQYELDRQQRFLPLLLSLSGLGYKSLRNRMHDGQGDVFDESLAYYATALRHRPVSAQYLQDVLSDYFKSDLRVEQFVGKWYTIPPDQRTRLGATNAALGTTALAGERVWQRDLCMRLWVGPLAKKEFDSFLPGGTAALALGKLLTLMIGETIEFEVKLTIKREEIATSSLGSGTASRLGWDSYLCSRPPEHDRSDAAYEFHTIH
jgi:type VI secretion system protein ImpH